MDISEIDIDQEIAAAEAIAAEHLRVREKWLRAYEETRLPSYKSYAERREGQADAAMRVAAHLRWIKRNY